MDSVMDAAANTITVSSAARAAQADNIIKQKTNTDVNLLKFFTVILPPTDEILMRFAITHNLVSAVSLYMNYFANAIALRNMKKAEFPSKNER
jgi:hypothetical protein